MSDPVSMARTARESLSRGLSALQGDPSVPPQIVALGQPIAQAMGELYKIEASRGAEVAPHAQAALASVQSALASLQAQPPQHPAVATAMEAVAGALGTVHALTRAAPQQAAPPPPPPPAPVAYPPARAAPAAPAAAYAATQAAAYAATQAGGHPYAAQPQAPYAPAPAAPPPAYAAAPPQAAPAPPPVAPAGDGHAVAAELGAHSPSNFYKGLSGNDIVDHGGLFVSTYKLPKIGAPVRLRVSMPGGYEFEANAVVRWRREPNEASTDAPPGFGAQFTDITPEARQLIHRYVRNREPMFHDDL